MKKRKFDFHIFVMRLAAVLLSLVMLTTGVVSGRYARYVTSATGSDSARVAKFTVTQQSITRGETEDLTETIPMPLILPGESHTVNIAIAHDAEVAVNNIIEVSSTNNLPLQFSVSDRSSQQVLGNPASEYFAPGIHTKEYTVTISWPDTTNAQAYIGMVDLLTIKVTTQQVD